MKYLVATLAAAVLATDAHACPELDALVKRYGISFSGFARPIPAVKGPGALDAGRLLAVSYPEIVSDGFRHAILFNARTRKAWILRTGGFAGVREWYGPVEVGEARLENCHSAAAPSVEQAWAS
jgi:hypothetical protein